LVELHRARAAIRPRSTDHPAVVAEGFACRGWQAWREPCRACRHRSSRRVDGDHYPDAGPRRVLRSHADFSLGARSIFRNVSQLKLLVWALRPGTEESAMAPCAECALTCVNACGQGRDRTGDLPLFSRSCDLQNCVSAGQAGHRSPIWTCWSTRTGGLAPFWPHGSRLRRGSDCGVQRAHVLK
jgi:hypothetical protein